MSDSIKDDDKKFNELITKQHPTFESFSESLPESEDVIENDDNKIDELLYLQDISSGIPEYASIEEKYEEEFLIDEVAKMLDNHFKNNKENYDPFSQFFIERNDEQ